MIKNDLIYQRHHIYKFIWQINIIRWCFHRTKQLLLFWDVSLYEDVYQWEFETATLANHMYSVLVYLFLCEFSAIFKPFCILRCVIVPGCSRAIVENSALNAVYPITLRSQFPNLGQPKNIINIQWYSTQIFLLLANTLGYNLTVWPGPGESKVMSLKTVYSIISPNRHHTQARLLGFSYDFGVTIIKMLTPWS
jgi:hypothetical protein